MTRVFEFPELPGLPPDLRRDLVERSRERHVAQGSVVFTPSAPVDALLILLSGMMRVQQVAQSGREIVLYRVHGGESCILTAACLITDATYAATGIAETDLDLMSLPKAAFDELMARSQAFRGLIFQAYAKRVMDLMQVVEEVAFRRIDIRLAGHLVALSGSGGKIAVTQQHLSTELGTASEVISRQLGEFQRLGWVEIGRGHLRLRDRQALTTLAQSDRATLV